MGGLRSLTEIQPPMPEGVGLTCFTGVCGLDGHSQAPRDGFMASRETGEGDTDFKGPGKHREGGDTGN